MTSEPVIQIDNVTRVYTMGQTQVHALRGLSLTIRAGEMVAIAGASGSGKVHTDEYHRLPGLSDVRRLRA